MALGGVLLSAVFKFASFRKLIEFKIGSSAAAASSAQVIVTFKCI